MKVTVLGSGASGGVPMIGPVWGKCDPTNPRNRRRRASILVESTNTRILIDASPDCRSQLLDADVSHLDGVIFTHAHADHCHGIDDLRWVNQFMGSGLAVYSDAISHEEMLRRFGYAFAPFQLPDHGFFNRPVLEWQEISDSVFQVGDINFLPYEQDHGFSKTLGLRFGNLAYSTDLVKLDDAAFDLLVGIDVWFIGCLSENPHPTHANLETVLEWIDRVRPKQAYITHMNHMLDYDELSSKLPDGVVPAYDGMVVEI